MLSDRVKVHDTLSQIQNLGSNKKHDKTEIEDSKVTAELIKDMSNINNEKKFPGKDYYDLG